MENTVPQFVIVPYDKMEEILQKLNKLSDTLLIKKTDVGDLGDYITEKEAKVILNKGTTWMLNKRESGELTGKFNGKWNYKKSDILSFIENGKTKRKINKAN